MSLKENVLDALLENPDSYISGEQLAESLGVSRNSVWKSVKQLESDGYKIEAVSNRGYHILQSNVISEKIIQKNLKTKTYGQNLITLAEVDSTNNYAKKLANEGAADGTVVVADAQTAGKGRMGRSFCSPKGGGLYVSLIIRPTADMSAAQLITACAAVAVAEAIESLCDTDVKIKWVNDLFIGGRKICGILTEASISFESKQLEYAIIGIGINVGASEFPYELKEIVTSIEEQTGNLIDRNILCASLLNSLEKHINSLDNRSFMDEYRRRSFIIGCRVSVTRNGKELIGKAIGINDEANLIVQMDDGEEFAVSSGEARICR